MIILCNPKYPHNVAGAIRAASCFGVDQLFWTGSRVNPEEYDRLPREERMKGYKDVRWVNTDRPFDEFSQKEYTVVCVELLENSENLTFFEHPEKAVYMFGPEDGNVPQVFRRFAQRFVHIPSAHCLNLTAALNVVLYDRRMKRQSNGIEQSFDMLHEHRGFIDIPGWEGK